MQGGRLSGYELKIMPSHCTSVSAWKPSGRSILHPCLPFSHWSASEFFDRSSWCITPRCGGWLNAFVEVSLSWFGQGTVKKLFEEKKKKNSHSWGWAESSLISVCQSSEFTTSKPRLEILPPANNMHFNILVFAKSNNYTAWNFSIFYYFEIIVSYTVMTAIIY